MELVRLTFPRRMDTQSPFDYAAEVIEEVKQKAASIRGVRITKQPQFLCHFTCEFAWVWGAFAVPGAPAGRPGTACDCCWSVRIFGGWDGRAQGDF